MSNTPIFSVRSVIFTGCCAFVGLNCACNHVTWPPSGRGEAKNGRAKSAWPGHWLPMRNKNGHDSRSPAADLFPASRPVGPTGDGNFRTMQPDPSFFDFGCIRLRHVALCCIGVTPGVLEGYFRKKPPPGECGGPSSR